MQRSLATSSIECAQLLDKVTSLLNNPKCEERSALVHDEMEDQSGRLRIWAGNLGAFQRLPAASSLDHRLRESPKVAAQIQELLQDLQDALQNVFKIASGERPNRQYEVDDENEFGVEENEDNDSYYNATNAIEENEKEDQQAYLSEAQELFESAKETIGSLFRISILIRNASPRDRFVKALSSTQDLFDDSFDISHVGHKFPSLNIKENQWLKERLGKAITDRRRYLRYVRVHRDKLGKEPADIWEPGDQRKPGAPAVIADLGEMSQARRTNLTKPTSTLAPTVASTLLPLDIQVQEEDFQDDQSQTSYALSLGDDDDDVSHLHLPRLSDVSKGTTPFECPLCWTIQSTTRESSWRKHGFSDLRPYVCTFEKCDAKLFSDRRDWFDHEMKNHRLQWRCSFCKEDDFRSLERFREHLHQQHVQGATEDQLVAFCEFGKRPVDRIPAANCPFCNEWETRLRQTNPNIPNNEVIVVTPSQFRHHVGSHMQQLALFAIPRGYLEDDAKLGSTVSREVAGIEKGDRSRGHSSLSSFKSIGSIAPSSITAEELNRRALEEYRETPGKEHPYTPQSVPGRGERNLHDVNEAKANRKAEIERRCQQLDPPIPPNVLRHIDSFKAAIMIAQPMNDYAWSVLLPRLMAHLPAAQQAEADHVSREWEESQRPIHDKLSAFADDYINQDWDHGRAVTYENSPKFAADLLVYVRRMFYADIVEDEGISPHVQQPLDFANGPEPHRPKLVLENMKWVYDNKLKPLTEQFRKELFVCYGNGCEGNTRFYSFEGVIQHFGARHTNAFSVGNVVVAWRDAEWPEETPFHPDPISVKHSPLLASKISVLPSNAKASRTERWLEAIKRSRGRLDASDAKNTQPNFDVYEAWGETQGSPTSPTRPPTRPPSVHKRQSMQILDLNARVEQLIAKNRALKEAIVEAGESMQAAQYQRQVDTQVTTEAWHEAQGSSKHDPVRDNGKGRADMAGVYEEWGEAQGSPMSPRRPPSVRKRQSMQVLDLNAQIEELTAQNRALEEAVAKAEESMQVD